MIQNTNNRSNVVPQAPAITPAFSGLIQSCRERTNKSANDAISVGFVSYQLGEGVSTNCVQSALACYFETEQDVLIIGTNPPDNILGQTLGINSKHGLNHVIERDVTFQDAIKQSDKSKLHLLESGVSSHSGFSPFLIARFPAILEQAQQLFQVVLVDLPPLDQPNHSPALANKLDAVVLILDPAKTSKSKASNAKRLLQRAGVNLAGVIVNKFDQ